MTKDAAQNAQKQNAALCYVGLGSNLGNALGEPLDHMRFAIKAFARDGRFWQVRWADLYRSKAFGVTDQPDFLNTAARFWTRLSPLELLDFCQNLEAQAGRVRKRRWGERSLDVDVLLYADRRIDCDRLVAPHPGILQRNFVAIPLLQLDGQLTIDGRLLKDSPAAQSWEGLERVGALLL